MFDFDGRDLRSDNSIEKSWWILRARVGCGLRLLLRPSLLSSCLRCDAEVVTRQSYTHPGTRTQSRAERMKIRNKIVKCRDMVHITYVVIELYIEHMFYVGIYHRGCKRFQKIPKDTSKKSRRPFPVLLLPVLLELTS